MYSLAANRKILVQGVVRVRAWKQVFFESYSMRVKKSPISNQNVFKNFKIYGCQGNHAKSIFLITTKIGYSCLIAHIFII